MYLPARGLLRQLVLMACLVAGAAQLLGAERSEGVIRNDSGQTVEGALTEGPVQIAKAAQPLTERAREFLVARDGERARVWGGRSSSAARLITESILDSPPLPTENGLEERQHPRCATVAEAEQRAVADDVGCRQEQQAEQPADLL